jgi:NAD(P)-dependent dehydrogenase (short-subunit alcohol dehydrogenase family)
MARLLALNLAAPASVVKACASLLKPGARVVNVASGAGLRAIPWRGAYSPSKAGLIAQTQALAQAHPEWCVTVLCPGFVRTELVDTLIQAGRLRPEGALGRIPLGRMAQPDEMAQALYFLASPGAAPLSGQVMSVDGGSSVYGGSQPLPPSTTSLQPMDLPMRLEVVGGDAAPWHNVGASSETGPHCAARLDLSPLSAASAGMPQAVHAAATRFVARYTQSASLTLLLPPAQPGEWTTAGDRAAARMLVASLACEWGSRALRINAVELPADVEPPSLHPLLRYVGGAGAQFFTGQTLVLRPRAAGVGP